MNDTDPIEVAKSMSDMVNRTSAVEWNHFVNQILHRSHRTLQQNVGKVVVMLIKGWAKKYETGDYDMRNADTCLLCHQIDKAMSEDDPDWGFLSTI